MMGLIRKLVESFFRGKTWEPEPWHPVVREKMDYILPYIEGKAVIDVGAVGQPVAIEKPYHAALRKKMENGGSLTFEDYKYFCFHHQVEQAAMECVAIDLIGEELEARVEKGWCRCETLTANIEDFDLGGRRFDTVFAGDILEHLHNVGNFLTTCNRHLKMGGHIVIVTPNASSLAMVGRALTGAVPHGDGDHIYLFHRRNLELLLPRFGFEITDFAWHDWLTPPFGQLIGIFARPMSSAFICVAEKVSDDVFDVCDWEERNRSDDL